MRSIVVALFLALAASAAGCSVYRSFTYSTPEGTTCLSKCENARWACRSACGDKASCLEECEATAKACRKNCPEPSVVEPDNTY